MRKKNVPVSFVTAHAITILPVPSGGVHENTPQGLDSNRLGELRMAEWELPVDQFTDLGHLFAATTNVVVIHSVEVCLLVFALDCAPSSQHGWHPTITT